MDNLEEEHESPAGQAKSAIVGEETTGMTRVEPIDLSPMVFDSIERKGRRLMIDPPLSLDPTGAPADSGIQLGEAQ